MDRSFQDVGIFAMFGCTTGVLLRAEKTPGGGMRGVYVGRTEPDVAAYGLKLNAQGEEIERTRLRFAGGQIRFAPPADPASPGNRPFVRPPVVGNFGLPARTSLPIQPPAPDLRADTWNQVEILLNASIVRTFLNNGGQLAAQRPKKRWPITVRLRSMLAVPGRFSSEIWHSKT